MTQQLTTISPQLLEAASGEARVHFQVSESLVERFAELTGDRSTLHVDDAMARRTAYRQRVVHGMLPVAFLAAAKPFRVDGFRCALLSITGKFLAPVTAGDRLVVVTGPARQERGEGPVTREYRIENAATKTTVTSGVVTVSYRLADLPEASEEPDGTSTMLTTAVPMSAVRLEEIEVGTTEHLEFQISSATRRDFVSLLQEGIENGAGITAADLTQGIDLPSLLSVLLFSTSIGVSLPGKHATFLEFSASVEQPPRLDARYALAGEVVHRSRGTRIVKKQMLVHSADAPNDVAIRGRVAALVNKPSTRMPSVDELRDLGTTPGLDGKVVVITGASRGIGETTAKLLALCGAKVVVNYHRGAADANRVVAEIRHGGGTAIAIGADVTSADDVAALVDRTIEQFGAIDILVNNAVRDYRPIPFLQLSWDDVQKDLDVIAKGAFLCCQRVIPSMLARGGGRIINIASVATDDPPPDQTKYVMAKSALVGLTRSLSVELAAKNIQVNMVVPSFVETDLVAHIQEGFRNKIARETPMGRNASPVDVARAVLFLASSYSSFTTGQRIMVTGGGAPYA